MIEEYLGKKFAFHELQRKDFPLTLRFLDKRDRSLIEEMVIDGPGAVKIPPLGQDGAREVLVETIYPNGHRYIVGPGVDEFLEGPPPPA